MRSWPGLPAAPGIVAEGEKLLLRQAMGAVFVRFAQAARSQELEAPG